MKESGGDVSQVADLVSLTPDDFVVLAGAAATLYPMMCVGAVGGILALANALPEPCVHLFELTKAGRHEEAIALQRELVPVARLLGAKHGVPGLKAALNLLGYDVGVPRPPLLPLPESIIPALREALAHFEEIPA
jgi:4-hydroxy-2-oxoglutarate aldolase